MASSEFFNDHHSPVSSNEHSAASSPYMVKPPVTSIAHRQRSSSMNSITSNHSVLNTTHHNLILSSAPTPTNARSMSIVSIESPRNSIVSLDEHRPLREDSYMNLGELGAPAVPGHGIPANSSTTLGGHHGHVTARTIDTLSDANSASHHPHTMAANDHNTSSQHTSPTTSPVIDYASRLKLHSSALFSDDDSELDLATPPRHILKPIFRLKKRSSGSKHEEHLQRIKSDFRFHYDEHINSTSQTSPPLAAATAVAGISSSFKHLQDPTPSPLSLNSHEKLELAYPDNSNPPKELKAGEPSSKLAKKTKQSTSMQKMYLKKIYSKDLQFELFHNVNISPPVSPTISYTESFTSDPISKFAVPQASHPRKLNPSGESLSEQNKVITKLNQKWNKSMYGDALEKSKKDDISSDSSSKSKSHDSKKTDSSSTSHTSNRKRSRHYFSSLEDDSGDDDSFDDRPDDFPKEF